MILLGNFLPHGPLERIVRQGSVGWAKADKDQGKTEAEATGRSRKFPAAQARNTQQETLANDDWPDVLAEDLLNEARRSDDQSIAEAWSLRCRPKRVAQATAKTRQICLLADAA